jgi:hypothetical protein
VEQASPGSAACVLAHRTQQGRVRRGGAPAERGGVRGRIRGESARREEMCFGKAWRRRLRGAEEERRRRCGGEGDAAVSSGCMVLRERVSFSEKHLDIRSKGVPYVS